MSERRSSIFYPLLLGLILFGFRGASAQVPVPQLSGRVVDLTSTLDSSDQAEISAHLEKLEQEKGAQVVVLLVPSTKPESVEEFALRVASEWKLGRKGVDDGVVFLIAKDDRKMRIEVGYGLEGAISDIAAKRILSDIVTPYFRAGNLPSGIEAGVNAISGIIKGESLPAPSVRDGGENIIPVGIIIGLAVGSTLGGILGRLYGGVLGAALSFKILIFGVSAALSLMISIFVGIFAAFSDAGPGAMLRGGRRYGGGGGFGGGFGGGGFGGGGGSFGGGGASGNW